MRAYLGAHRGEVAALILEPMNRQEPAPGFLAELKDLVHAEGALLIFDEIITGFRYALGGAQELFGVVPDLAALGKGLGNGMPISAVVGRADVMREMEEVSSPAPSAARHCHWPRPSPSSTRCATSR